MSQCNDLITSIETYINTLTTTFSSFTMYTPNDVYSSSDQIKSKSIVLELAAIDYNLLQGAFRRLTNVTATIMLTLNDNVVDSGETRKTIEALYAYTESLADALTKVTTGGKYVLRSLAVTDFPLVTKDKRIFGSTIAMTFEGYA